jgi:Mlc titration factor MtfA (ptsG expression regulator)
MTALLATLGLTLLFGGWMLSHPWRAARRRRRIAARPFPSVWRAILRRRVPMFRRLPPDLQQRVRERVQVFLAEKAFIGCGGQVITDEVRVTVAAQAVLLRLHHEGELFPGLRQVLVYPGPFIVGRVDTVAGGVQQEQRRVLAGESWSQGQVVLSWPDCLEGAEVPDDGRNVVIHEFAHQLDQENGAANGAPPLPSRERYARWSAVMQAEYEALRRRLAAGEPGLIDPYGATEPAEFFAVASEVFFERPAELAAQHPALYAELSRYYRVHPAAW